MSDSIKKRQNKEKSLLISQLKRVPVVQLACEKTSVSRATYYRWYKNDPEFAKQADEALNEGASLINDLAETQLISLIRDRNLGSVVFWLKSHHPSYRERVEVTGKLKHDYELTPEQEALITKALDMITTDRKTKSDKHKI
ncbi:MAG: hypothetical protein M1366_00925 [Patescibacteria group bacterium]|nr:hypothetical protein [Patescibacteria group bacterium]